MIIVACRVPEECPQWVADLIATCMSEEPQERPTSRNVYQRLLSGGNLEPSLASQPSAAQREALE